MNLYRIAYTTAPAFYFDARYACFSTKARTDMYMAREHSTSMSQVRCHDIRVVAPYTLPALSQVERRIYS